MEVKRTERGWAGHFISSHKCLFRRNTLLEYDGLKIVVSSVGLKMKTDIKGTYNDKDEFEQVGLNRFYETQVFHANYEDDEFIDADVARQISVDSDWATINKKDEVLANERHEIIVYEIIEKLKNGERFATKRNYMDEEKVSIIGNDGKVALKGSLEYIEQDGDTHKYLFKN